MKGITQFRTQKTMQANAPRAGGAGRAFCYGLILAAGLLAFAGCLRADFYMDDFGFILNYNGDGPASRRLEWWPGRPVLLGTDDVNMFQVEIFQLVPTCFYLLTERLVPDVTEASWLYHLWNLLLHLAAACLAWYSGRQVLGLSGLLKDDASRNRAALAGAVLFACHPLCSEPVHYAKCLNSITVAMFGLMMTGGLADWLQSRSKRAAGIVIMGFAGATLSYFPGMALAVIWGAVLAGFWWRGAATAPSTGENAFRWRSRKGALIAAAGILIAGIAIWRFAPIVAYQFGKHGAVFPDHLFTQGRLFWDYLAKALIPAGLCSDYAVPWSRPWGDAETSARLILALLAAVICAVFILLGRQGRVRGWALIIMLAILPLLMRFGYVNTEHFVEYRIYPSLPWIMLLAGAGMMAIAQRYPRAATLPLYGTAIIAMLWIGLSVQRSVDWTSRETLALDAAKKFPLNPRPLTQLQAIANDAGEPGRVLELHDQVLAIGPKMEAFAKANPGRYYDTGRFINAVIHSCQWKTYALADQQGSRAALEFADEAIASLKLRFPGYFIGEASGNNVADAWPLLMARNTVAENAAKIDAARAARSVHPAP